MKFATAYSPVKLFEHPVHMPFSQHFQINLRKKLLKPFKFKNATMQFDENMFIDEILYLYEILPLY